VDPVTGNGTYTASTTLPTTGTVAGAYTWTAHYSGDANNNSANDQGGSAEQTVVSKANPKLVTTASSNITLGTTAPTLSDSAVLSGGYLPDGLSSSITFTLTGPGGFSYTQVDTVTGNGTYTASTTLPTTGTVAGTYTWTAHYSGDANNKSANDQGGSAEQTVVSKASPTIITTANPTGTIFVGTTAPTLTDSAVLSGGYYETGTITFKLTGPGGYSYTQTDTVSGNGTYTASNATHLETAVGTYTWTATYNGDPNNNTAKDQGGSAEQVTISDQLSKNEAATMGFWANNNGQALLKTYTATGTASLGSWLATNYPHLFGNLSGATGTQVAAYFIQVKNNAGMLIGNTYAQALAVALAEWVTGPGWNTSANGPTKYGFTQGFGGLGLGSLYFNVGNNGASFNVPNNTMMTVAAIMTYFDSKTTASGGTITKLPTTLYFYSKTDTTLTNGANNVLDGINQMGDIT
jgi:hypothetical protein